ncbi:hypothetical protein PHISP_01845 [Aspergillus sp. HF37]|nr:hypothetical protein PHISP_01845 [Aspergillus sp. HF37]
MPRHARRSDSETDFSETDESFVEVPRRQRTALRERSRSRRPRSPDFRSRYLSPPVAAPGPPVRAPVHHHETTRVHRSASTGGGRRAEREPPPAVIVDIQNDSRNKSSNRSRRNEVELSSSDNEVGIEEEEMLRPHYRRRQRPRASTSARSVSRDHSSQSRSPRGRGHQDRDFELVMDQRLLEKNDTRQDMELMRQQQEIERLERELARRRESGGNYGQGQGQSHRVMHREEEEWYEDEIRDRLKKLDRLERKQWMEEERRRADMRWKMKRFEDGERQAAEREEVRARLREEKLKEMEEEEERERMKQELRDEEARRKLEEEEKRMKALRMKQEAVQEWKLQEEARAAEELREKEEKDKEFQERLRCEFGYTEEEIEKILARRKMGEERNEERNEKTLIKEKEYERTTWIKVHRRHLLPETLMSYRLPWDWDDRDSNYIIIKMWISEDLQDELFAHTRRLREGKLVTETSSSTTELKVNDRRKDRMYLVRKKSPSRRSWIFTT